MTNHIKTFPDTNFPVGKFRAFVVDCIAEDTSDDKIMIYVSLILVECKTQTAYSFEEAFENNVNIPYSKEFFDFIDEAKIEWLQYEDLIGLTFNTTISCGYEDGKAYPMLSNRELLATSVVVGE